MERYVLKLNSFETHFCKMMCSLMESQILVDLTITCKSYSLKVHKNVLAARSEYFREKLQKDLSIDSILVNGMKPSVLKSLITFIYCGGTSVAIDDMADLISAGDYFCVPGIKSILKDKFNVDVSKKPELNLNETPPLFFSNNMKVNINKHNYNSTPVGILSTKCNAPGRSKEARCLLVKEQAASELALKVVQRNKSKLIVTEDTSTMVTVEADLTSGFDDAIQLQEYIIENFNKSPSKQTLPEEPYSDQINEVYVLQPDDENFVDNNAHVFEELSNGHTVSYQLIPQNKNDLEIQEYICNTINDYNINSATNLCFIPENTNQKIQMTYAQLSTEAVTENYITNGESDSMNENHNSNIDTDAVNENYISEDENVTVIENYNSNSKANTAIVDDVVNVETDTTSTHYESNLESDIVTDNYNSELVFLDLENPKSPCIFSDSQKTRNSVGDQIMVEDTYDEDSGKYLFDESVEWKVDSPKRYNLDEFSDNAVEYAQIINLETKRPLKRKHDLESRCNDEIENSKDSCNIQYFDLDQASIVKYTRNENCDYASNIGTPLESVCSMQLEQTKLIGKPLESDCSMQLKENEPLLSEIVPEEQDIKPEPDNMLLLASELQEKDNLYEVTNISNSCEAKSKFFTRPTTAIDILSFDEIKDEELSSKPEENRRQTRSLTKQFLS